MKTVYITPFFPVKKSLGFIGTLLFIVPTPNIFTVVQQEEVLQVASQLKFIICLQIVSSPDLSPGEMVTVARRVRNLASGGGGCKKMPRTKLVKNGIEKCR